MPAPLSSLATEYLRWAVTAYLDGTVGDPTAGTVEFAFTRSGSGTRPAAGDWRAGGWETTVGTPTPQYVARVLVGPSAPGGPVSRGDWTVWIRVTYPPETVVESIGTLTVT